MSKKWAIYKTEYGKAAREYVDNMEQLRNSHLYAVVKEEYLPIILNRGLGYIGFDKEYEEKKGFLEIVISEEFPLTREDMFPKNSPLFLYGWIDREGNTYTCGFEDHSYAADVICEELKLDCYRPERTLEELGWIKISKEAPYTPENVNSKAPYCDTNHISKAQYDKICEIGLGEDWRVQGWFYISEPEW